MRVGRGGGDAAGTGAGTSGESAAVAGSGDSALAASTQSGPTEPWGPRRALVRTGAASDSDAGATRQQDAASRDAGGGAPGSPVQKEQRASGVRSDIGIGQSMRDP